MTRAVRRSFALLAVAVAPAAALVTGFAASPAAVFAADAAPARTTAGGVSFVPPAGFKADPAQRPMRVATFSVGEAPANVDVVISSLGGQFGSPADNVNRWRGQVGLPPLPAADAEAALKPAKIGDVEAKTVDLAGEGEAAKRLVVVMAKKGETTYFFRILGPAAGVAKHKDAFDAFVASVKFEG